MSTHGLLLLLLVLIVLVVASGLAGVIGYGVSRAGGSSVTDAIGRGSFVFFSAMTLFTALLGVLLPVVM